MLETQFNDNDANKAASQLQAVFARNPDLAGVFGANLFSALGAANGVQQAGQTGTVKVVAFDAPTSIVDNIKTGLVDVAIAQHPAEIGYFGVVAAYRPPDRPVGPDRDRHRLHGHGQGQHRRSRTSRSIVYSE